MIEHLRAIDQLRRQAATQSEKWHAAAEEVFDENGVNICTADSKSRAGYIAELHNQILIACSLLFQLAKKQVDRISMTKEQQGV